MFSKSLPSLKGLKVIEMFKNVRFGWNSHFKQNNVSVMNSHLPPRTGVCNGRFYGVF
jgi:hypothetical protein